MYVPRHFAETRVDVLHDLIRRHPLGTLVVAAAEGLEASHVPFEIDAQPAPFGTLRCHVARANPLWQQITAERPVLVVFQGEQGYVSPSWYAAKSGARQSRADLGLRRRACVRHCERRA